MFGTYIQEVPCVKNQTKSNHTYNIWQYHPFQLDLSDDNSTYSMVMLPSYALEQKLRESTQIHGKKVTVIGFDQMHQVMKLPKLFDRMVQLCNLETQAKRR